MVSEALAIIVGACIAVVVAAMLGFGFAPFIAWAW